MNTEATHDHNEAQSTGVRLRNAREQLGLSQQAVAERLCLKVSTVRDIEEDKAPADLASTFLRGYIRSYARLVHIPEEELLPGLEKQAPVRHNAHPHRETSGQLTLVGQYKTVRLLMTKQLNP